VNFVSFTVKKLKVVISVTQLQSLSSLLNLRCTLYIQ